jgi:transketolase
MAAGMAFAAARDGRTHRYFVIMGDGECDEGSVWEAAMVANHYELGNLVAIVDHNRMQSLDYCEATITLQDFAGKWRAFGWNVIELDGHDHDQLRKALAPQRTRKPTVILANTVKGKGISFMEESILWHYRYPHDGGEYEAAVAQLDLARPGRNGGPT